MAPAKTPIDIRARIERALAQAMQEKALSERIAATDAEPRWMPATAYGEFMKSELARWGTVVQAAGLKPS
jgi:tripartite-type tricarboxylate transporter receptor subunit TctC